MKKEETMKYIRYGIGDVVFTEEENKIIEQDYCSVAVLDEKGKVVGESELYYVATEDEDGNEIEESEEK